MELIRLESTINKIDDHQSRLTLNNTQESRSGVVEDVEEETNNSSNTSNQSSLGVTSAELLHITNADG